MEILNSIVNAPTFIVGLFIIAAVFLMAGIRYKETKQILKIHDRDEIKLMTFGVNFYGQESLEKKPLRSTGGLVLLEDGLYYHARFGKIEHFIEGKKIKSIGTTDFFCDKPLHQQVVSISFTNDEGKLDRAAFRIPHPAQWVRAIKISLMS